MTVHIHTDGSCHGNPGPGGWAAIILTPTGANLTLRDGASETTNNRMELTAVIRALQALENMPWAAGEEVVVHTDSRYVCNAFQQDWVGNWQRNGWRTAKKQPVLNQDLWEELIPLVKQHSPEWVWVKGHSGDHWNELCDQIANEEAEQAVRQAVQPETTTPQAVQPEWNMYDRFFGKAATREPTEEDEPEVPEEAPGSYNRGWQDGYEAARQEFMQALQSMGSRR